MIRIALAVTFSLSLAGVTGAHAAKLSAADQAWINTCITQRKDVKETPARLRNYCICMHDVVDDNQPFDITELERTYPPIHEFCVKKYRTRR